jgi:predicted permease
MKTLRRLLKRLTSWTRRRRDEERLQAEIEEHLAMQTAENVRRGMAPGEARRQAALKFGGVESMREDYRAQKGLPFLEDLIQDTRYALRRLRKSPAFTMTTVLTLALGIGATTSIFTLVYTVILKTLAVAKPEELYRLGKESRCCYWGGYSQEKEFSLASYELYQYFRDNTKEFSELAAFSASEDLAGVRRAGRSDPAEVYPEEEVSGNYFAMFGIQPYTGRLLTPNDDRRGAPPVAVMSYRLWQQRYGSDPSVIGSIFNLSDRPYTVVGITPPGFFGDTLRDTPPDFFVPLAADDTVNDPQSAWLDLIGRIRPDSAPTAIEAEMRVELKQWLRSHWGDMSANDRARFAQQTLFLRPGGAGITSMREQYERWLEILMTVSGLVLLIVCANVANLMLVRGLERRLQTSLSMALGARASRLVREALTESVLLALAGGAAGVGMAFAGTRLILHYAFPATAGLGGIPIDASPSMPVLAFAFVIALVTGVAFGVAPAWMATRTDPIEALRGASRATARSGSLPRKTLVVLQAALSLVLLSAAGLLIAALGHLENQDFGFEQDRRLVVTFDPRLAGYQPAQLTPLYQRIHESLSRIPGVSAVALAIYTPMSGNNWGAEVWIEGQPHPGPKDDNFVFWNRVTAGYFPAVGDRIVRGRGITEQDRPATEHVAVVNEAFARKFFKHEDPIGKYFGRDENGSHMYRIAGVAKDARYLNFGIEKPIDPSFFLPEEQHDLPPRPGAAEISSSSHYLREILVVTKAGATVSFPQLRQAMASVDPNLPIIKVRKLSEQVAATFGQQRLIARLTSFFGVLSLVLASVGLYGVTAYNAGRRVNEIGVRMAMGADRWQIVALIVSGAFRLILFGLLIGLPLTLGAGRLLGSQLYGFNPYDPEVMLVAVMTLGVSALIASLVPALRSSSISPLQALRD